MSKNDSSTGTAPKRARRRRRWLGSSRNALKDGLAKNAAPISSAHPMPVDRLSSKQRSRLTNGTALLPDIDGRSAIARRFKDITSGILADQGGADQCSESRLQLVRRFAAAAVLAEQLELRLANGEQIDIQEHALLCSTLARLASRIGINRITKNVTPKLSEYLTGAAE